MFAKHNRNQIAQVRWQPFTNGSGLVIPAFAVLQITACDANGLFTCVQPTIDTPESLVVFNGEMPVGVGEQGMFTADTPIWASYDDTAATPANGETWGAKSGSWQLAPLKQGFTILGGAGTGSGTGNYRVQVQRLGASGQPGAVVTTSGGTTTLVDTSPTTQFFVGTSAQTVVLPDATNLTVGQQYSLYNYSTGLLTVKNGAGTVIYTVYPGTQLIANLQAAASSAGTWLLNLLGQLPGMLGFTTTATAGATTTLTNTSAGYQAFTGTMAQTVVLPDARTLYPGQAYSVANNSTGTLTLQTNGGATLALIPPGAYYSVGAQSIGSAAGTWNVTGTGYTAAAVAGGPGIPVRLTADVSESAGTLTNLTDLTLTLPAAGIYEGTLTLKCVNTTPTDGLLVDFNGGGATALEFWVGMGVLASGGADVVGANISTALAGPLSYTTITGETVLTFAIYLKTSGAGTFIPRFKDVSHTGGTATVRKGSTLVLTPVSN